MSTPATGGPEVPGEKKGLSKLVTRMRSVLKRSDGSKRLSFSSRPSAGLTALKATAEAAQPEVEPTKVPEGATKVLRSQIDTERAKKLAERFALTVEPFPARPEKESYRIEKPIRMRIHRTCHVCDTTFGSNKVCAKCEHVRCKQCPRYPVKKDKKPEDKGKAKEGAAAVVGGIEVDTYYGLREQIQLTKPNPKPGAQPLVRKKPMQRVRRTCHECQTLYAAGVKICSNCGHVRCTDCPRDPAKKKKYPDGYPGDAWSSDTSHPVKYSCHKCNKVFPAVPHPDSPEGIALAQSDTEPLICVRCKHPRCSECPRAPPSRVEPAPDPDVLKSVEAKLAALNLTTVEA